MKRVLKYSILFFSFFIFIFIFFATYNFYRLVNDGISLNPFKESFIRAVNSNLSFKLVDSDEYNP